jgi:nucleotide-binding universal stress UspA family protein
MTAVFDVREILFPTDFSTVSRHAATTAGDIARHFGARVHVLHVSRPGEERAGMLEGAVADLGPRVHAITRPAVGSPARTIVQYAAQAKIDLIVMGTHGRTGFSHALLGSVTEAVVRLARCRVLTVPGGVAAAPVAAEIERCVVCALPSPDLICEPCRDTIRGEALVRGTTAEGSPSA